MSHTLPRIALLVGNFITGVAVLSLAGMLPDLADGLGVTIQVAGFLVTAGAVVLCVGSPLMVWATSRVDRRRLLGAVLLLTALGHGASALAPSYEVLLLLRVSMMAVAALFTPLAASSVALIVPPEERAGGIAFVFLGFSLAVAVGLPIVTFLSTQLGWRATFAIIGVAAVFGAVLVVRALPDGLRGAPLSLQSWIALGQDRLVLLLLLLSTVQVSGQFLLFTYLRPLTTLLAGGGVVAIGVFFALTGVMGVIGNALAARLVVRLEPYRTSLLSLLSILLGFILWSVGAGALVVMGVGVAFWGLGFAALNSMQQARLIAAAPHLASASVSLNTSAVYVGQAIGSAIGGLLFARGELRAMGLVSIALGLVALGTLRLTRPPA